jgi:hypothetical protein
MFDSVRRGLLAAALIATPLAWAQPPSPVPDPLDARAEVPLAAHRSVFAAYRAVREVQAGNWKEANDRVARIGGWRAYAREAAQPASTPAVTQP